MDEESWADFALQCRPQDRAMSLVSFSPVITFPSNCEVSYLCNQLDSIAYNVTFCTSPIPGVRGRVHTNTANIILTKCFDSREGPLKISSDVSSSRVMQGGGRRKGNAAPAHRGLRPHTTQDTNSPLGR